MNTIRNLFPSIVLAGLAAVASPLVFASPAAPKVAQAVAKATALTAVPSGRVQSAELETEHGKQIWSFDIKQAGSSDIVEVQIDAKTGAIVSKTVESARDQRNEALADQKATR